MWSAGRKREFISRSYNFMLQSLLGAHFSDAQCGFKAIRADIAQQILPHTVDNAWFFDTELLVLAESAASASMRCRWTGPTTPTPAWTLSRRPSPMSGAWPGSARTWCPGRIPVAELRAALARGPLPAASRSQEQSPGGSLFGQLVRFGSIGVASTLAYLLLFFLCRNLMDPQLANLLALLATAVANTAANRRFTFGIAGSSRCRPPPL